MTVFEYFWNQKNKFVDLLWHRETKRVNELAVLKLRYIIILPTQERIWNENVQRKFCQESSNLPFAVPGNVKLKLPNILGPRASRLTLRCRRPWRKPKREVIWLVAWIQFINFKEGKESFWSLKSAVCQWKFYF
jgi:hypothetical protein